MRSIVLAAMTALLLPILAGTIVAQTRVSDKDVEALMKNLNEEVKKFRKSFDVGIGKSSIRKTSREKESKALVERFEQRTEGMLKNFKKNKKAEAEIRLVRDSADKINQLLVEVSLDTQTMSAWKKVWEQLEMVSKSLGSPE